MRIVILAALILASCGSDEKEPAPLKLSAPETVQTEGMAGGPCEPCHPREHVPLDLEAADLTCVDFDELPSLEGRSAEGLPPGCPKIPTLSALAPGKLPESWGMSPKKD